MTQCDIKTQMDYGRVLIDVIGYKGLIAGGAPRDWFCNQQADDLDLYVFCNEDDLYETWVQTRMALKDRMGEDTSWTPIDPEVNAEDTSYAHINGIHRVFEVNVSFWRKPSQRVQFIFMDNNRHGLLHTFCVNLSEASYDGQTCNYTRNFMRGMQERVIVHRETPEKYLSKIMAKFPYFAVVPYSHSINYGSVL